MASQKTLTTSLLMNSPRSAIKRGTTNTKSVLEKLKSLSRRTVSRADNALEGLSPPKSSNYSSSNLSEASPFSESQNETWELVKKILCPPPGLARSPPTAVPGLRPGGVNNKWTIMNSPLE